MNFLKYKMIKKKEKLVGTNYDYPLMDFFNYNTLNHYKLIMLLRENI